MVGNGGIYLYVSENESGHIVVLRMADNGELTKIQQTPVHGHVMPMAITPDRRFLYAGIRTKPYSIASFAINAFDGTISQIGRVGVPESPVYLSTDRTGHYLLAAYNGRVGGRKSALVSSQVISNGVAQPAPYQIRTPPKMHSIMADPSNRFVLAQSCDGDLIVRYAFNAATGELNSDGLAPVHILPKSGPRHIQFHPNGKFFYLVNEHDASVVVFSWNAENGMLRELQTASAAPAEGSSEDNFNWRAADIHFTPDARWLYVSTRDKSRIVSFRVDPVSGLIERKGEYSTVEEPRSFAIDPSGRYLFSTGLNKKSLASFSIDAETGSLNRLKEYEMGEGPNWIECVRLP